MQTHSSMQSSQVARKHIRKLMPDGFTGQDQKNTDRIAQ
jgi:hypothetical protein